MKPCTNELIAVIPKLTLGSVIYLITDQSESALTSFGTIAEMGIRDATLSLTASQQSFIQLSAHGSPMVIPSSAPQNPFTLFIDKASSAVTFKITASMLGLKEYEFDASVGTQPIKVSDAWEISNLQRSQGASVFARTTFNVMSGMPPTQDFGMRMPLLFHPKACDASGDELDCSDESRVETIAFDGELYFSIEAGQALVQGSLTMIGTWYNAFGMSFLHLSDLTLGIGFNMAIGIFPPSSANLGGSICIGTQFNCKKSRKRHIITGAAYVGMSFTNPADNYFMAKVSALSLGKLFSVLGSTVSKVFKVWRSLIPLPLLETRLKPFSSDHEHAFMSFSPGADQHMPDGTFIRQGLGLSGRLDIMGYSVGLEASIGPKRFYVNVDMDQIDLGFLKIGAALDGAGGVKGNPKFIMDYAVIPPKALIDIEGAFSIPILQSSGQAKVVLSSDGFEFSANMNMLFGTFVTDMTVNWDWEMTKFEARIKPTSLLAD